MCSMKFESFLRANTITGFSRGNSNHSILSILQDKQEDTRVSICKPEYKNFVCFTSRKIESVTKKSEIKIHLQSSGEGSPVSNQFRKINITR